MLDLKRIKADPQAFEKAMASRRKEVDVQALLNLDKRRRELIFESEQQKAFQNTVSKQIGAMKQKGEDPAPVLAQMKEIADKIKEANDEVAALDTQIEQILLSLPNMPNEQVPVGASDADNPVLRTWGEPTAFDFEPLPHWELGKNLGILDPETAAKVTGTRFHFYRAAGARLERAIISFFLDTHSSRGYTEVLPPYLVNRASMQGTGQLPKFEEDAFKVANTDYFLIPTAEVPVTNYYRDSILDGKDLPISFCAYSACFRAEAGSAGRDTRGLIRQHQFNKVELVKFCSPETSYDELEKLTADAEHVLQLLGLPYRVVRLCTGDLGFSSAMTYDIEVWMPSYNRYVEISSCSDFEDFQARRANIRFKATPKDKPQLVHTLNGSGVAVGRTVAAILENYQQADGSIVVPEVLRPYMGCDVIR